MTVAYKDRVYLSDLSLDKVREVLIQASEARLEAKKIGSVGGCGRVYVDIGKVRKNSKLEKLIENFFPLMSRPYNSGKFIYVGYDNASGLEWNMGEKIAESLNNNGVHAYVDGDGD